MFLSKPSREDSNKLTNSHFVLLGLMTNTFYSTPNNGLNHLVNLYGFIQNLNISLNSVSADNLKNSSPISSNQRSHAVQRQQGVSHNPTSALLSARAKGYSLSSHVTQQMLHRIAFIRNQDKTVADSHTLSCKSSKGMSSIISHFGNPTVTPATTFTTSK